MASRRLLLQLGAVAAASCLLAAATCPVDAALPPPPPSRDAPATSCRTDVPRTVDDDDVAAAISRGARRLGPPRHLRSLSDIPADAPAGAASDDIPADAPAASYFQSTFLEIAFVFLLTLAGAVVVLPLLVAGLVKLAALLASFVAGLYAAARTARDKARVRPLDQDAVEAAGH